MCRNIKTLFNFEPPASEDEIHASALQFAPAFGLQQAVAGERRGVQVLRDPRGLEDEVARVLELPAQPAQVDVEEPPVPLAHLARDDHGFDVAALHQRHHGARHVVERRRIDSGLENDDVGFLARLQRPDLAIEPEVARAVDRGPAQHIARGEQRQLRETGGVALVEAVGGAAKEEGAGVHEQPLQRHRGAHLGEEVRGQRDLDVGGERGPEARVHRLQDRRRAVAHVHLDRHRERYADAGLASSSPGGIGHAGHVDEKIVGPNRCPALPAAQR